MSAADHPQWQRIAARKGRLAEGVEVARLLPTRERRMVGAWCFLDHLGPVAFPAGQGMHVGAHPHTHLQTFTWMIEGEILHRDSLGSEQVIRAGQVNLMTAGHGIAHTEDTVRDGDRLHAVQLWIALPQAVADQPPAFEHYAQVPQWREQGCDWVLMAGHYAGHTAPTRLFSPLLGMEVLASETCEVQLTLDASFEYGLVALEGGFAVENMALAADELLYLPPGGSAVHVRLQAGTRLLVLGGEPLGESVLMWWNFLGADWASIRAYRAQWEQSDVRFGPPLQALQHRIAAPALP